MNTINLTDLQTLLNLTKYAFFFMIFLAIALTVYYSYSQSKN